tara:strand:- start:375 stop:1052 length:678 start_codon:yes stop_codon:yes gene_type:complete
MFRMAAGGEVPPQGGMMPPPQGGMMPPPQGEMPPEMQQIAAEIDAMPPEMQQAEARKFFEQAMAGEVKESVDQEVGRSIQNLEGATGFKDIMNAVWDEDADVETYRARLAAVVGPQDAAETPVSVLALIQPTLQLAQLDQGVGALMQEELAESGGGMGGGITEIATKSAVADGMANETAALVDAVGGMSQAPSGIMATGGDPMGMDPEMMQALMQDTVPMGQGLA